MRSDQSSERTLHRRPNLANVLHKGKWVPDANCFEDAVTVKSGQKTNWLLAWLTAVKLSEFQQECQYLADPLLAKAKTDYKPLCRQAARVKVVLYRVCGAWDLEVGPISRLLQSTESPKQEQKLIEPFWNPASVARTQPTRQGRQSGTKNILYQAGRCSRF